MPGAEEFVPARADLAGPVRAAADCRGCDLYRNAIQTVFGDGDPDARVVLMGEQPGDQEDRQGKPFVGPAGRLLHRALDDAGVDRSPAYVTNAVKHVKFVRTDGGGKRRIHESPDRTEVLACRPWLTAELDLIGPDVLVCLGATAGKAVFGPSFTVTRQRGTRLEAPEPLDPDLVVVATIHPSAVLRSRDRVETYDGLVSDLRVAAAALG